MAKEKKYDAVQAAQEVKPTVVTDQFKVNGKSYQYVYPQINVPGIGKRTALECLTDDDKHNELGGLTIGEFLVIIKSGSIQEV